MTEHTASLEPIEIFRASDERITNWVDKHLSYNGQFRSPDSPPSAVEEIELGSHHSDEGSSHSLPPKMVLKYPDGRGDIPISHWHYDPHYHRDPHYRAPAARSRPQTPHQRSKSAMGHRPPPPIYPVEHNNFHYHSEKHGQPISPDELHYESTPEDIKILPADPNVQPQRVTGSYRPRRLSEPFREHTQSSPNRDVSDVFDSPPPRYISNTFNIPVVHSQSQHIHDPYSHHHPSHAHSRGNRPPPPIVYAPGHHRNTDHFAPPAIVHGSHKPPGMNHAGSSPSGPQYPRIATKPYPPVHGQLGLLPEEPRHGPRGPRPRDNMPRATPISQSTSGSSNSTYYVLPNAGQKVKVLVSPEQSASRPTSR